MKTVRPEPSSERRIQTIVVAGGGTAGWMAAAVLSRFLNNGSTRLTLIESEEIGTVGVGEATIPPILGFNRLLGIDEAELLSRTQGTIKLGIEFADWGSIGDRYLHAFGTAGSSVAGIAFHQIWGKLFAADRAEPLDHYSTTAEAARQGRFAHEGGDRSSAFARPAYAYQFDASLYARFLRDYAERRGVHRIEGRIAAVEREPARDHVRSLVLADGRRIDGELFIDCTGFRALLIGEMPSARYEDWSRWLPCDRAVALPSPRLAPLPPFTRATAREAGWQWRIPLQHRTGNGYVYASEHLSADAAEHALRSSLNGAATGEARHLAFTAGVRPEPWIGNVVALGLSSGFLEPLESTSIHLIQSGLSKLMALFPDRRWLDVERRQYNRLMEQGYLAIRDFLILHYKATVRDDTPFWRMQRAMSVPDSLAEKMELFRAKGRIFRYDDELFGTDNWLAVMLGQGISPDGYDPLVDALDEGRLTDALGGMRRDVLAAVARMPTHEAFLQRYRPPPGT